MTTVNMHDAKTRFSQLVEAVESGKEEEIIVARNGIPAVRIVPIPKQKKYRFGLAKGKWVIPDDIDVLNPEIEKLFYGEES